MHIHGHKPRSSPTHAHPTCHIPDEYTRVRARAYTSIHLRTHSPTKGNLIIQVHLHTHVYSQVQTPTHRHIIPTTHKVAGPYMAPNTPCTVATSHCPSGILKKKLTRHSRNSWPSKRQEFLWRVSSPEGRQTLGWYTQSLLGRKINKKHHPSLGISALEFTEHLHVHTPTHTPVWASDIPRAQWLWPTVLTVPLQIGSSRTRDQTRAPCFGHDS